MDGEKGKTTGTDLSINLIVNNWGVMQQLNKKWSV